MALGITKQAVYGLDDDVDDINVLPLIEATDIVGLVRLALVEDEVNGTGMVLYIESVTHILTLSIDGKWLALTNIVNEERDQFLGKLIGTIIVGAVGDYRRHAVGVVIGTYEMVTARL